MRIIFMGTPEFACPCLEALIKSHHTLLAVYTQPDRPRGRGRITSPSPVKTCALQAGIPVHQPAHLKDPSHLDLMSQADLIIVIAYGLILPESILSASTYGALNVHASCLPRWRGAAPIQRAIQAGDTETGITLMQMDAGLDTGPCLKTIRCIISPQDTSSTLNTRLAHLATQPLLDLLNDLKAYPPEPQPEEGVLHAPKLKKSEACIDWSQPADLIERCIRAFQPWPICYGTYQGQRIKIWTAHTQPKTSNALPGTLIQVDKEALIVQTGSGCLALTTLQLSDKKPCAWPALHAGYPDLFVENTAWDMLSNTEIRT